MLACYPSISSTDTDDLLDTVPDCDCAGPYRDDDAGDGDAGDDADGPPDGCFDVAQQPGADLGGMPSSFRVTRACTRDGYRIRYL